MIGRTQYTRRCILCNLCNFINIDDYNAHLDTHIFNFEKICDDGIQCLKKNCNLNHITYNKNITYTEYIKYKNNVNNDYYKLCKFDNPWKGTTGRCKHFNLYCSYNHFEGYYKIIQNKRSYNNMINDISQERNIKSKYYVSDEIINNSSQEFNTHSELSNTDTIDYAKLNTDLNNKCIEFITKIEEYKQQIDNLEYEIIDHKIDLSYLEFIINDKQEKNKNYINELENKKLSQQQKIEYFESIIFNL